MLKHPLGEELFPNIQPKHPLTHFLAKHIVLVKNWDQLCGIFHTAVAQAALNYCN